MGPLNPAYLAWFAWGLVSYNAERDDFLKNQGFSSCGCSKSVDELDCVPGDMPLDSLLKMEVLLNTRRVTHRVAFLTASIATALIATFVLGWAEPKRVYAVLLVINTVFYYSINWMSFHMEHPVRSRLSRHVQALHRVI